MSQIVPEQTIWEWEDTVEKLIVSPSTGATYPSLALRPGYVAVKMAEGILLGILGASVPMPGQKVKITVEVIPDA